MVIRLSFSLSIQHRFIPFVFFVFFPYYLSKEFSFSSAAPVSVLLWRSISSAACPCHLPRNGPKKEQTEQTIMITA
jgi:hypothetical protein